MNIEIHNYTFAPGVAGAGTITFDDYPVSANAIALEKIALITNVTKGVIIFQFNDVTKNGTVLNNVLTLTATTATHLAGDKLAIKYADTNGIGGITRNISGSVTRPNNATAYAAGQVVGTAVTGVITLANVARLKAGSGINIGLTLLDEANQATKGDYDIFLFDTAPAAQADQVAFAPSNSEMEACLGVVSFTGSSAKVASAGAGASGNVIYPSNMANYHTFNCGAGLKDIYAVIVVRNAYIPIANEKFVIRIRVQQD
jgi:hypothetical protein